MNDEYLRKIACALERRDTCCSTGSKDRCVVSVNIRRVCGHPNEKELIVGYSDGSTYTSIFCDTENDDNTFIERFIIENNILYGVYNTGSKVQVLNLRNYASSRDLRELSNSLEHIKGYAFEDVDTTIDCEHVGDHKCPFPKPFRKGNSIYYINEKGEEVWLYDIKPEIIEKEVEKIVEKEKIVNNDLVVTIEEDEDKKPGETCVEYKVTATKNGKTIEPTSITLLTKAYGQKVCYTSSVNERVIVVVDGKTFTKDYRVLVMPKVEESKPEPPAVTPPVNPEPAPQPVITYELEFDSGNPSVVLTDENPSTELCWPYKVIKITKVGSSITREEIFDYTANVELRRFCKIVNAVGQKWLLEVTMPDGTKQSREIAPRVTDNRAKDLGKFIPKAGNGYDIQNGEIHIPNQCYLDSDEPGSFSVTVEVDGNPINSNTQLPNGVSVSYNENKKMATITFNCSLMKNLSGKIFEFVDKFLRKIAVFLGIASNKPKRKFKITYGETDGGAVSGPTEAEEGTEVVVNITTNEGYRTERVFANGDDILVNDVAKFTITQDTHVTGKFEKMPIEKPKPEEPKYEDKNLDITVHYPAGTIDKDVNIGFILSFTPKSINIDYIQGQQFYLDESTIDLGDFKKTINSNGTVTFKGKEIIPGGHEASLQYSILSSKYVLAIPEGNPDNRNEPYIVEMFDVENDLISVEMWMERKEEKSDTLPFGAVPVSLSVGVYGGGDTSGHPQYRYFGSMYTVKVPLTTKIPEGTEFIIKDPSSGFTYPVTVTYDDYVYAAGSRSKASFKTIPEIMKEVNDPYQFVEWDSWEGGFRKFQDWRYIVDHSAQERALYNKEIGLINAKYQSIQHKGNSLAQGHYLPSFKEDLTKYHTGILKPTDLEITVSGKTYKVKASDVKQEAIGWFQYARYNYGEFPEIFSISAEERGEDENPSPSLGEGYILNQTDLELTYDNREYLENPRQSSYTLHWRNWDLGQNEVKDINYAINSTSHGNIGVGVLNTKNRWSDSGSVPRDAVGISIDWQTVKHDGVTAEGTISLF